MRGFMRRFFDRGALPDHPAIAAIQRHDDEAMHRSWSDPAKRTMRVGDIGGRGYGGENEHAVAPDDR